MRVLTLQISVGKFYLRTGCLILFFILASSQNYSQDTAGLGTLINRTSHLIDNAEYEQATKNIEMIMMRSQSSNYKFGLAEAYNLRGSIYSDQSNVKEALENFLQALSIYEAINHRSKMASLYNNIGLLYAELKEYKVALSNYFKAVKIFKEVKNYENLGVLYNNIGTSYQRLGQTGSAAYYLNEAYRINVEAGDTLRMAMTMHNMGITHQLENECDSAVECFKTSLDFLRTYGEGPGHVFNYNEIGNCLMRLSKYKEAEGYLLKAFGISETTGQLSERSDVAGHLANLYKELGDYKKAYYYTNLELSIHDTIYNESARNNIIKRDLEHDFQKQKELQKKEQETKDAISTAKIENQKKIIIGAVIALAIVSLLVLLVLRGYNQKRKDNAIISRQKEIVESKQKEILASIYYAKRIQSALLTSENYFKKWLDNFFILYKPKDIVSGDFYWALEYKGIFYIIVADCTGHGVPGAFMSLLNISILNEAIIEKEISRPDQILNEARKEIIRSLNPEGGDESKDGMDCILCALDLKNGKMQYACANNSFFLVRNNEMIISETDKMPVGLSHDNQRSFRIHELELKKGDTLYLITDGYADQFGGEKGKKYKYKPLQELLLKIHTEDSEKQKEILNKDFEEWKGHLEQVDDVCLIGIKI
jgi:serine phosphatase RsbU (regulator of sigma subunit)